MQINKVHDFINDIISKEQTGYVSPEQIDRYLYSSSLWLFTDRLKVYAIDQKAQDDLAPFKKRFVFTPKTSPGGLITLPTDYVHMTAGGTITYDNDKEKVNSWGLESINDDELHERLRSQLDPVTLRTPVFQWAGEKNGQRLMQVYPKIATTGEVWYLKQPNEPKYAYSQVDRDITYDHATSVQLEWDNLNMNQVIYRALNYMGIKLDFDKMIQYANMQTQINP